MSYKTDFQSNNTDLQAILDMVNSLPDANTTATVSSVQQSTFNVTPTATTVKYPAAKPKFVILRERMSFDYDWNVIIFPEAGTHVVFSANYGINPSRFVVSNITTESFSIRDTDNSTWDGSYMFCFY